MADLPFTGIRKVFETAARLEKKGRQVIPFEIGRPDFDTPKHIRAAADAALAEGSVHDALNMGIERLSRYPS